MGVKVVRVIKLKRMRWVGHVARMMEGIESFGWEFRKEETTGKT
jgi:hypothetical protein